MKTFEGIYENGKIRLKENPDLPGGTTVYVFVPDPDRKTGIQPAHDARIRAAKKRTRERLHNCQELPGSRRPRG